MNKLNDYAESLYGPSTHYSSNKNGVCKAINSIIKDRDDNLFQLLSEHMEAPSTKEVLYGSNGNILISGEFATEIEEDIFEALCRGHPNDTSGAYMFSRALHALLVGKPDRVKGFIEEGIRELEQRNPPPNHRTPESEG